MTAKKPSPNDQHSTVKNPNNEDHKIDRDHRSRQIAEQKKVDPSKK
ncbi:MAG: hypothetical protein K9J17_09785 [Flavobacteriales bacterium]|nr:hypothetical protein [Flavobacteriales bacterium]